MAQRRDGAGKKMKRQKKVTGEGRWGANFYAQGNPIGQLLGDRELRWRTIGEWFFLLFPQKTRMGKRNRVLLEMLLVSLVSDVCIGGLEAMVH